MRTNEIGTDNLTAGTLTCTNHFKVCNYVYCNYIILIEEIFVFKGIYHSFVSVLFRFIYYYLNFILGTEIYLLWTFGIIISRIVSKGREEIFI